MAGDLRILAFDVLLDHITEISDDEHHLVHTEIEEIIEDVAHHRPSSDRKERLGDGERMRTQSGALAGHGNDRLHVAP